MAAAGLATNLVAFGLLRVSSKESLNVRGAYLEALHLLLGRGNRRRWDHPGHRLVVRRPDRRDRTLQKDAPCTPKTLPKD